MYLSAVLVLDKWISNFAHIFTPNIDKMPKTFLNFPNDLLAKSYFVVLFSFNMLTNNFGVSILLVVKCWLLLRYLFLEDLDSV